MASMINSCVEHGVTTFDHADIYGNYTTEREFGDALILSGVPRDQVQLITKCGIIKPFFAKFRHFFIPILSVKMSEVLLLKSAY